MAVTVGFVGAGRVGSALGVALSRAGVPVAAVADRRTAAATTLARRLGKSTVAVEPQGVLDRVDLVFLTVPDDAIEDVCRVLRWREGKSAVHCSGARSLDVLEAARAAGAWTGRCHPLQTLSGAEDDSARFTGSCFGIEADEPLRSALVDLVRRIGGRPLTLTSDDAALYHASAVFASNYLVALVAAAADLWQEFGFEQAEALQCLLPLIKGTVANLEQRGLPAALTGPIARGDVGTVRGHLMALEATYPDVVELYRQLGFRTVELARAGGLAEQQVDGLLVALGNVSES